MEYISQEATDRELEAMKRYYSDYVDYSMVKNKEKREKMKRTGRCADGLKHEYVRKFKNKNEMLRYCRKCDFIKRRVFTNDQLAYINSHLADFAQPGTALYHRIYGNRTPEEIRNLQAKIFN